MTETEVEQRLTALERELALFKAQGGAAAHPHPVHALEALHGTFENDEAFREAMRLGRQWRDSQRPKARKSKAKRR